MTFLAVREGVIPMFHSALGVSRGHASHSAMVTPSAE